MYTQPVDKTALGHCVKEVSWAGIIAGALVAIGLSFLFHLLSFGIGLSAYTRTVEASTTVAIGSFLWLFVGGYLILLVAGWTAGRIARAYALTPCHGALHGFLAWCLALILSMFLLAHFAESAAMNVDKSTMTSVQRAAQGEMPSGPISTQSGSSTEQTVNKIGFATLSTFFIFLAGALGSTVGGYLGIRGPIRRRNEDVRI